MAAKVVAQIVIQTATVLSKAFFTAYQQALHNAKSGGAAAPNVARVLKYKLQPDEAMKILNIDKGLLNRTILNERYKILFAANDTKKGGSFYLQSKVFRAHEVLNNQLNVEENPPPPDGKSDGKATGDKTEDAPAKK